MKLIHELYHPVIGILPIGDRFTMGGDQAAYACQNFFHFEHDHPVPLCLLQGLCGRRCLAFPEGHGAGRQQGEGAGSSASRWCSDGQETRPSRWTASLIPCRRDLPPTMRPLHGRWVHPRTGLGRQACDRRSTTPSVHDDPKGHVWTYMAYGPWQTSMPFEDWLKASGSRARPVVLRLPPAGRRAKPCGMGSFMRCDAANGVIEIGHIWMSPGLQKTREATEAIFLMIRHCLRRSWRAPARMEMRLR